MVSVGDTYFVGRLGTEPLAGLALVFPLIMLLQMTSAGAMGGGVSSAIARARLGGRAPRSQAGGARAGDRARHGRLVHHPHPRSWRRDVSPARRIGRHARAGARLLRIVFGGAVAVWIANTLSSVLRGTGNMLAPAATLDRGATIHLPLSGWLVARIGIAGAAIAYVTTFAIAALVMAMLVGAPRCARGARLDARMAPVPRDPARRRHLDAVGAADRAHRGHHHGLRWPLRRRGARGLRRRPAA